MQSSDGFSLGESAARRIVLLAVLFALFIVPFRIVGLGHEPGDDARRHAAKVVADAGWQEILVLRPEFRIDPHPGWHAVLSLAHRAGISSVRGLITFSVLTLALLFLLLPLPFFARPEAWLAALIGLGVLEPVFVRRILLGRPYLVSMAALTLVCLIWKRLDVDPLPRGIFALFVAAFAVSAIVHGSTYLWAVPVLAFVGAGRWRVAIRLAAALGAGFAIAALLSGHPIDFVVQAVSFPFWALGNPGLQRLLVSEFQPSSGAPLVALGVIALLIFAARREAPPEHVTWRDPVLLLALIGWALGALVWRFWLDWGLVATAIWAARTGERLLIATVRPGARARIWWTFAAAFTLIAVWTSDHRDRWSQTVGRLYIDASDPAQAEWLPAPGGILYNDSMISFYETFSRNPTAKWRYVLGFEPSLMPRDDLATYRRIRLNREGRSYRPWAEKLRPEDRLLVHSSRGHPKLAGIEWHRLPNLDWIGRPADSAQIESSEENLTPFDSEAGGEGKPD